MSEWLLLGLPYPRVSGYGYKLGVDLLRTGFETAHPGQERKNTFVGKTFTLSFLMTASQLRAASGYLDSHGYGWVSLPVDPDGSEVTVRLVADYRVSAQSADLYVVDLEVERQ